MRLGFHCLFLAFLVGFGIRVDAQLVVGTIGNTITWSAGEGYCCVGASLDAPFTSGADCSIVSDCSTLPPKSGSFICNPPGVHTVYACWYSAGTPMQCGSQTIEVTEPADPSCPLFDLLVGSRVLTHKYESSDTYPTGQTADAQMTLLLRARRAPGGTTIYLKVSDPPGTSPYGSPHPTDNSDSSGGNFSGSPTTQVALLTAGYVSVNLATTSYAAGDNYLVQATPDQTILTDPNFACATDCRSATIEAWKRAYLETDRMFRHGAMLMQDAPAGATTIFVSDISPFSAPRGQRPGSQVVIAHASRVAGQPAYFEPALGDPPLTVQSINSRALTITLSRPLLHAYQKADSSGQPWLADGIGVITGVDSGDYYTPNASSLSSLMSSAYVELVTAPRVSGDCGCVPYYANFTNATLADLADMGNRWNDHRGSPNTFHLIGASMSGDELGERIVGTRDSWVFVSKIESFISVNKTNLNAEATSHEATHAWDVNSGFGTANGGHCDQSDYANSSLKCLMRPGSDWTDTTGAILPEYYDGHVALHFNLMAPSVSEYLDIARHSEPIQ